MNKQEAEVFVSKIAEVLDAFEFLPKGCHGFIGCYAYSTGGYTLADLILIGEAMGVAGIQYKVSVFTTKAQLEISTPKAGLKIEASIPNAKEENTKPASLDTLRLMVVDAQAQGYQTMAQPEQL